MWSCLLSTNVSVECNRKIHKCSSDVNDFLCLLGKLMERIDEEELELVATTTRRLWLCRNTVVFGDLIYPSQLVRSAK